jgi:hypothetical protein
LSIGEFVRPPASPRDYAREAFISQSEPRDEEKEASQSSSEDMQLESMKTSYNLKRAGRALISGRLTGDYPIGRAGAVRAVAKINTSEVCSLTVLGVSE